jgi:hypothetical protein
MTERRRPKDVHTVTCPLTGEEWAAVAELGTRAGLTSEADLVRLGLWHVARHLDLDIPLSVFELRQAQVRRRA